MRILHVSYHKSWRGGEQQISYLVGELQNMGCHQWIYCSEDNALEEYCKDNGISYYTFSNNLLKRYQNIKKLKHLCQKHFIEIVHVHDSFSHEMAYVAGLIGNETPIILSRRVDFPMNNTFISHNKYNYHRIRKILCVSNKIKQTLEPDIKDKSKLTVIHDGIDLEKFNKNSPGLLRKQFKIPKEAKIIGYISALSPHKDHLTFIDTAEKLLKENLNAKFFIIGEGRIKKHLQDYAIKKGLVDHIIFTGFRTDVPSIIHDLDIFLFTSISEGLGTSILDAFASGVPVVSTNAGGIPEIIENGVTGLVADIKDSDQLANNVMKLLSDKELRESIIQNAKEKVKNFSKQIMAERTFSVYKEILNGDDPE